LVLFLLPRLVLFYLSRLRSHLGPRPLPHKLPHRPSLLRRSLILGQFPLPRLVPQRLPNLLQRLPGFPHLFLFPPLRVRPQLNIHMRLHPRILLGPRLVPRRWVRLHPHLCPPLGPRLILALFLLPRPLPQRLPHVREQMQARFVLAGLLRG
jgi:hypothetical protein